MNGQFRAFEVRRNDPQTIAVVGDIDVHSVLLARREGEALLCEMEKACEVDLIDLGQAGSVVMSMLLCWMRLANAKSVELSIVNAPQRFSELCRASGLDRVLFGKRR
ncbi:MAG: NTP-binding protein [Moraxellaceae bacterium]|nr:MAG: NTP-binding protein [Moraxellaceae bacterium]